MNNTLCKHERICRRTLIDRLFRGGSSKSMAAFPVRVVYLVTDRTGQMPQAQMMVSVSKRFFKKAVDRNRVKRQIREAYRKNKTLVSQSGLVAADKTLLLSFIWMDGRQHDTASVEQSVRKLMERVSEKICRTAAEQPSE